MYETLTPWHEVVDGFDPGASPPENPFTVFLPLLTQLGIPVANALDIFTADYYSADCFYSDYSDVYQAFLRVFYSIEQKYSLLIQNYPFNELKEKTRTPNLKRWMSATSSGSADVTRNQTETVTETPPTKTTREHFVNPYDNPGYTSEYKDENSQTGNRQVTTSYTGQPDHTASGSSGSRTDTETGYETTTEKTIGKSGQSIGETLADYLQAESIFKMIEEEIAKKIFLQVWR